MPSAAVLGVPPFWQVQILVDLSSQEPQCPAAGVHPRAAHAGEGAEGSSAPDWLTASLKLLLQASQ